MTCKNESDTLLNDLLVYVESCHKTKGLLDGTDRYVYDHIHPYYVHIAVSIL